MSIKYILHHLRFVRIGHRIALTLILALFASTASYGQENLEGEGSVRYLDIYSDEDWVLFANNVKSGNTYEGWIINLRAPISLVPFGRRARVGYAYHRETITVPVIGGISGGEIETYVPRPFSGTFNGNGYHIVVHIDEDTTDAVHSIGTALFGYIKGATIKNLYLSGTIVGGNHAAGLVGVADSTGNRIENCLVEVSVAGGTHVGGVLGHGKSSDISIDSVVFDGYFVGGGSEAKGAFFGWGDEGGTKSVTNSLYVFNSQQKDTNNFDFVKMNAGSVKVENLYKTVDYGTYGTLVSLSAPKKYPTGYENLVIKKRIAQGTWNDRFPGGSPSFYVTDYPLVNLSPATTEMTNGFYWVTDDVTIENRIAVNGDAILYLDSGKTLNATKGIEVSEGGKLKVDGPGKIVSVVTSATTEMSNGFYQVTDDVTVETRIKINGDVTLFLDEGKKLTVTGGIELSEGNGLAIKGPGSLQAGGLFSEGPGIGSEYEKGGTLVIESGEISARGGSWSAGIGAGREQGVDIEIRGGTVAAYGGYGSTGIGGSEYAGCGVITIIGGKVKAVGERGNSGYVAYGIGPGRRGNQSCPVTLGWTNDDDYIYASSYGDLDHLAFAEGKSFYYVDNGVITQASTSNIGGKTIYPFKKKSLEYGSIKGIKPGYVYSGNEIGLVYKVFDIDGNELVENTHYTVTLDKSPVKDEGIYTLTVNAVNGSGYTSSKSVSFEVCSGVQVTAGMSEMTNYIYRVNEDVQINKRITINGDVTLILDEGCTLNATRGIELANGNKLTITGQGTLNASGDQNNSGIGAYDAGTLVIESGIINATGGKYGAGIGGSVHNIGGGNIEIKGGTVNALGGDGAAGIGGGYNNWHDQFEDYGVCGVVTITGGKVWAESGKWIDRFAEGIGAGEWGRYGGSVTIGWTNDDDYIHGDFGAFTANGFVENKQFYCVKDGINTKVTSLNISYLVSNGLTMYPFLGENSLKHASISGMETSNSYTGNEIGPSSVTGFNGETLTSGVDYEVSITKNGVESPAVGVGEYVMTFTGKGNYEGTKEVKFSIVPNVVITSGAVQVLEDENGKRAVIEGEYKGNGVIDIATLKVDAVEIKRDFTANTPASVFLPFDLPEGTTFDADFYQLTSVVQKGNAWKATMTYIGEGVLPKANTPYVVVLPDDGKLEFDFHGKTVNVQTSKVDTIWNADSTWFFTGVYQYKTWEDDDGELGIAYAFAGRNEETIAKGKFGKIVAGGYAYPLRAYMRKKNASVQLKPVTAIRGASGNTFASAYSIDLLPETIDVEFVKDGADGEKRTTFVGRMDARTGEIRLNRNRGTYDLKGRRVNSDKRNAHGAYYGKW